MPILTPRVRVLPKATDQRTKSMRLSFHSRRGVPKSSRLLTDAKTIEARHAYGSVRNAGVRATRTRRTMSAVHTPCIGEHEAPHEVATRAEREREPAAG